MTSLGMGRYRSLGWLAAVAGVLAAAQAGLAAPITISNRAVDGDGRYWATVDDYGSIEGWTGQNDAFNPAGAIGASAMTFTSGTFVFVSNTHRELLSDCAPWQDTDLDGGAFSTDGTLTRAVTSPNVPSDTNGDGFADTLQSAFTVTGTGVNLLFSLLQSIVDGSSGTTLPGTNTAIYTLEYTITNSEATPLTFKLTRHNDGDSMLVGTWADDYVTADDRFGWFVGQNEAGNRTLGYTLAGSLPHTYTAGPSGILPQPTPPYVEGFTNSVIWTSYGLPAGWVNFAGGIGANLEGTAGPPGGGANPDSGVAMEWTVTLDPGASTTITMTYVYGGELLPEPTSLALLAAGLGAVALRRRRRRV